MHPAKSADRTDQGHPSKLGGIGDAKPGEEKADHKRAGAEEWEIETMRLRSQYGGGISLRDLRALGVLVALARRNILYQFVLFSTVSAADTSARS